MTLYAVVDKKAKQIVSVFPAAADEAAKRSFMMLLTSPKSTVFTDFPEDFDLYAVCDLTYDYSIKVAQVGSTVEAAGFKFDHFIVNEPLDLGSSYDKRYLEVVRTDRAVDIIAKAEERINKGVDNDA